MISENKDSTFGIINAIATQFQLKLNEGASSHSYKTQLRADVTQFLPFTSNHDK